MVLACKMPSAFSRRRSRNSIFGTYEPSAPATVASERTTPGSAATRFSTTGGSPSAAVSPPVVVEPAQATPATATQEAKTDADDIARWVSRYDNAASTSNSPSVRSSVKAIEKNVRKSKLSQAWEEWNRPPTTEERIKRVLKVTAGTAERSDAGGAGEQSATRRWTGGAQEEDYGDHRDTSHDGGDGREEGVGGKSNLAAGEVLQGSLGASAPRDGKSSPGRISSGRISPGSGSRQYNELLAARSRKGGGQHEDENHAGTETSEIPSTPYTVTSQSETRTRGTGSGSRWEDDAARSNNVHNSPMMRKVRSGSSSSRNESGNRRKQGDPLHVHDMIVGGNNCMIDHAGSTTRSATKLNTMRTTFQSSLHDPRGTFRSYNNADQAAIKSPSSCFKEERNSLIGDLSELWRQIDFLEGELQKANNKNLRMSSKNRAIVEKLASKVREHQVELEKCRKEGLNDSGKIKVLARELNFARAEQRRLHHLANTKMLKEQKTSKR